MGQESSTMQQEHQKPAPNVKKSLYQILEVVASWLTHITKICVVASILLSSIFVNFYLKQFDLPFVPVDDVLPIIVYIFAITFAYFYMIIALYALIPITVKYITPKSVFKVLPNLFIQKRDQSLLRTVRPFLREYVLFYLPFLSMLFLFFPSIMLDSTSTEFRFVSLTILAASTLVGLFVLWRRCQSNTMSASEKIDVLAYFPAINLLSIVWAVFLTIVLTNAIKNFVDPSVKSLVDISFGVLIIFVTIFIHVMLSTADYVTGERIILSLSVCGGFLLWFWLGFGYIGGFILRNAGFGGGTQISYKVEGGAALKGCLVWVSSNYLVVMDRSKDSICLVKPPNPLLTEHSPKQPVHMLKRENTQILKEDGEI